MVIHTSLSGVGRQNVLDGLPFVSNSVGESASLIVREVWGDKPTFLENFVTRRVVCEFDPVSGLGAEWVRSSLTEPVLRRGYYVKVNEVLWAVAATEQGPVLFRGPERVLLEPGRVRMAVTEREATRVFRLMQEGREVFALEYDKPKVVYFNSWTDDQTDDFFLWLCRKDPIRLLAYYTVNW